MSASDRTPRPRVFLVWTAACALLLPFAPGFGETWELGSRRQVQRGGQVSFEPRGGGVMFGPLDPTVRRWYIPEELYNEYRWLQSQYSNYGRRHYQRYVNTAVEGDYFYDYFGDLASRGFLVYDWRQEQPLSDGSSVFKGDKFAGWFSNATIARDKKRDRTYSVTVGSKIRTTLTPLTFSKAAFDGVQVDFTGNRYAATILGSRISNPIILAQPQADRHTNSTSMFGGRAEVVLGDRITVGGTFVDARNSNSALELFAGDLVAGNLTSGQSRTPLTAIAVVLRDDSPADGVAGAALFEHDVRITTRDVETGQEQVWTLADVVRPGTEWPLVLGGFEREGFRTADGDETIILNYDFTDPGFQLPAESGLDETHIVSVEFGYVLANDYKVEIWSNKQTGRARSYLGRTLAGVPSPPITPEILEAGLALLPIARADGNVTDISNIRKVVFEYGLPTANLVAGGTNRGSRPLGGGFLRGMGPQLPLLAVPERLPVLRQRGPRDLAPDRRRPLPDGVEGGVPLLPVRGGVRHRRRLLHPELRRRYRGEHPVRQPADLRLRVRRRQRRPGRHPGLGQIQVRSSATPTSSRAGTRTTTSSATSTRTTTTRFRTPSPTTRSRFSGTTSSGRSSCSEST